MSVQFSRPDLTLWADLLDSIDPFEKDSLLRKYVMVHEKKKSYCVETQKRMCIRIFEGYRKMTLGEIAIFTIQLKQRFRAPPVIGERISARLAAMNKHAVYKNSFLSSVGVWFIQTSQRKINYEKQMGWVTDQELVEEQLISVDQYRVLFKELEQWDALSSLERTTCLQNLKKLSPYDIRYKAGKEHDIFHLNDKKSTEVYSLLARVSKELNKFQSLALLSAVAERDDENILISMIWDRKFLWKAIKSCPTPSDVMRKICFCTREKFGLTGKEIEKFCFAFKRKFFLVLPQMAEVDVFSFLTRPILLLEEEVKPFRCLGPESCQQIAKGYRACKEKFPHQSKKIDLIVETLTK